MPTTTRKLLPEISGGFYPGVVGNSVGNDTYNSFYFDNDWTKSWGSHTIHFGGEVGEIQYANPGTVGHPNGTFSFGNQNTQYNPLQRNTLPGINDGFSVGDMLLGDPASGGVDYNDTLMEGFPIFSFYAQDDWKVSHKLTLSTPATATRCRELTMDSQGDMLLGDSSQRRRGLHRHADGRFSHLLVLCARRLERVEP